MITIIIVHYHVKKELFDCIQSILNSKPKITYEIIVVDNDEKKSIKNDLLKQFPKVIYVPNINKGFGHGNNTGAKHAKGEYLFFLNPDTIVFKNTIDVLYQFLQKHKKAGVVAPFLLHENKKPFEQQGVKMLTPIRAIFSISFINKLFPNNPVAKKYFVQWDTLSTKQVDVVPGTAFMISKSLYSSLNGFDENFFLYFEEFDLCKRIKDRGYTLFIEPKAKIIHLWERSTKKRNDISKIFNESRFYYFKKHFGLVAAYLTNLVLNFGKYTGIFFLVFIIATFLLVYKITTYMDFIPDQAWFYLSARNMILGKHFPLVGIASSHPWLHQGAYWTYLLGGVLVLGHFNPVSGAFLSIIFSLLTIIALYKIGTELYSPLFGLIASTFYATSPYIIFTGRMPYHTTPIPFFVLLLFYVLYKWMHGFRFGLPLVVVLLTILYNFEIATFMLTPIVIILLLYGLIRKTQWIKDLTNAKMLMLSLFCWVILMIPMILYDIHNGYPQTLKFVLWICYKIATVFGYPSLHPNMHGASLLSQFHFASFYIQEIIIFHNEILSWLILAVISVYTLYIGIKEFIEKKKIQQNGLLVLFYYLSFVIYLLVKTNSSAYLVIFFPLIALMIALFFANLLQKKILLFPVLVVVLIISLYNIFGFFTSNFLFYSNGTLASQIAQSKYIISESNGHKYTLVKKGIYSNIVDYTLPYAYLTWWLGHGPSYTEQPLHFIVNATKSGITVTKSTLQK